ncbi:MAG: hypothetical protein ACE5EN_02170 [Nitrospinota bacterium]
MKIRETIMKIILNNEEIEQEVDGFNTLGDLLENLKRSRFGDQEFISAISVNGDTIEDSKRAGLENRSISEITSLEISTDHPLDVSLRVLENMGEFLRHLVALINQSADKFRMDDETDANKYFVNCVEGLQTFVGVLDKVRSLNNLDLSLIQQGSVSAAEKQDELLKIFNSLHVTQTNRDWIAVADLLEYELAPLISDWKDILPAISSELRKNNG